MKTPLRRRLLPTLLKGVLAVAILFSSFGYNGLSSSAPTRVVSIEWVWRSRSLINVRAFRFSFDRTLRVVRQTRITKWVLRYVEQQITTAIARSFLRSVTFGFSLAHPELRMFTTFSDDDYLASPANE